MTEQQYKTYKFDQEIVDRVSAKVLAKYNVGPNDPDMAIEIQKDGVWAATVFTSGLGPAAFAPGAYTIGEGKEFEFFEVYKKPKTKRELVIERFVKEVREKYRKRWASTVRIEKNVCECVVNVTLSGEGSRIKDNVKIDSELEGLLNKLSIGEKVTLSDGSVGVPDITFTIPDHETKELINSEEKEMDLKVNNEEEISKFIETVIVTYKDKNKQPTDLFYEIHDKDGKKIGGNRKGVTLDLIKQELSSLGEGSYSLQDKELKLEVAVVSKSDDVKKPSEKKNVRKSQEVTMSEDRGVMGALKENGMDALDKAFHGAKVRASNKAMDALLIKLWAKSGKNELIGMALQDPMGNAFMKMLIAFAIKTAATEKPNLFPGATYATTVSDLIIEGSGGELVEPLMDMIIPMIGELVSAGQEISTMKMTPADAKAEEYDVDALAEELRTKHGKKDKVATA